MGVEHAAGGLIDETMSVGPHTTNTHTLTRLERQQLAA